MKKKLLALVIVIIMLVALLPTTAFATGDSTEATLIKNVVTLDANDNVISATGGTISSQAKSGFMGYKYWVVTANANPGYDFVKWEGDNQDDDTDNPNWVPRYGTKTITAYFKANGPVVQTYTVSYNGNGSTGGSA